MSEQKPSSVSSLGAVVGEQGHSRKNEVYVPREVLIRAFSRDRFRRNLAEIVTYGQRSLAEAGFIVQQVQGQPVISEVVRAEKVRSQEDHYLSQGVPSALLYDLVLTSETGPPHRVHKQQVILALHCHPVEHYERPEDVLCPSEQDLDGWQQTSMLTNNPYAIEGIAVKISKHEAALLLFQRDPTQEQNTYYQQWVEEEPAQRLFALMRQSGIRFDTLTFDVKGKQFSEQELEKLIKFAVE
jgi:MarR-like DNA-binding transcriptional regulator SgrR of sgrS sRNA